LQKDPIDEEEDDATEGKLNITQRKIKPRKRWVNWKSGLKNRKRNKKEIWRIFLAES